ncbi:type III secretion system cytoplasmic ring protein SctQ [Pyxidicoccus fallax]|uniref:Flagellar motor switch protein FliM n=1 Tax=Pyxidicoccus fallax TaxID=394095 RepID=A0A848LRK0_9BACT|nr:type III secretion system cytoplasmic ring protein SctQ [Pyxidicoccus fallax]NMO20299.1 type III secretion system cytoplasmic ring protein SctQ [Pyxidicoccus fallax]NPC85110.1 type III secretion system cytoplasmic ring protein SctQ [Pyxidicoccus fallax]
MKVDAEQALTRKVRPLRALGLRRLTRAHLTLAERPRAAVLGREALDAVVEVLSRELGCPVKAEARLLEAAVAPVTGLAQPAVFALLELSAVGGMGVLELEPALAFAALERIAGAGQRPGVVTELARLEEATLAYLLLLALSAVRARGGLYPWLAPRLSGVTMRRAEVTARLDGRQSLVAVELSLTVGPVSAGARLLLPAPVLQTVFQALPVERAPDIAPEVLAAALETRCLIGQTPLPATALEALVVGDVVLFEGLRRDGGRLLGRGRLVTRGFALAGDFLAEGFSLTRAQGRATSLESDMVAVNEKSEGMPPLPVDVEIELTRVMLPLSELAALKPGSLLPLHISANEPVLLRVGDRAVARAELVEIEGEVGARVLALLP